MSELLRFRGGVDVWSMTGVPQLARGLTEFLRRAQIWWAQLDLLIRFTIASTAIVSIGMLFIGNWVSQRITDGVVHSNAAAAALYTDSFIEPQVQELADQPKLTPESERALDLLILPRATGRLVVGFRIWKGDIIVFSDRRELIGQTFPLSPMRRNAWSGRVAAEYNQLDDPEHPPLAASKLPVLEIYAPVRQTGTGRIIALAETYQVTPEMPNELAKAKLGGWTLVVMVTVGILLLQFIIVREGSRIIQAQRGSLRSRIAQLSQLLRENETLQHNAREANRRVTEMNERYLRQIGADLHDGPVQLLGSAVLRLNALSDVVSDADRAIQEEANEDISVLRDALRETLEEIRNLSAGLALPEIETLSLADTLERVAQRHERRTGKSVRCEIGELPDQVPLSLKSCLYRFAQEGLSNAFRHATGRGQTMIANFAEDHIEVNILDEGPGVGANNQYSRGGQGLIGLRDRIESLGGEFHICARPGGGTCLTARFKHAQVGSEAGAVDV